MNSIIAPGNTAHASIGRLCPFMLDNIPIRGRVLRIDDLVSQIPSLTKHDAVIGQCLAELLAAATVMANDLKQGADVTIQIHSDGPASLLVAQCSHNGSLKAYCNKDDAEKPITFKDIATDKSMLVVTIKFAGKEDVFQSMVALNKTSVSSSLEQYFEESVQLKTCIRVLTERDGDRMPVGALFIQATPQENDASEDDWTRMAAILDTLTAEETLPGNIHERELLRRLFAEDTVRIFPETALNFVVSDMQDRMERALISLGVDQCKNLLEEGPIEMTCEFTGITKTFSETDLEKLFGESWV
ncbi:MAG: Hsp33 family molecular chaperone HslO [Alphaproteobacteria bacterium]|nr:Hsp33 family molecular chaperone HslO [Alphaproteobacteria bacterium]